MRNLKMLNINPVNTQSFGRMDYRAHWKHLEERVSIWNSIKSALQIKEPIRRITYSEPSLLKSATLIREADEFIKSAHATKAQDELGFVLSHLGRIS